MTHSAPSAFVNWFRGSAPYIHAHRNKTLVIFISGETIQEGCNKLIHDLALLKSLGLRLVLVHGIRPQINQRLSQLNQTAEFYHNLRITDDEALCCVKEAAGSVRVEIEAMLSMGLANSPMAGAKIKVASGNFVFAKPIGIIKGIDYKHTGQVRRIENQSIAQQLDQDNVVLISPVGYSPTGDVFNLVAEHVAKEVAIALKADKLILITETIEMNPQAAPSMTVAELSHLLSAEETLTESQLDSFHAAIESCQQGVQRVHLIDRHNDGALLQELFSREGAGILISSEPFESIRPARLDDIAGLLELIQPLEEQGLLVKRSREKLEMEINDYVLVERDGLIIACSALHRLQNGKSGEIACLAVHPDYQNSARGNNLLEHVMELAKSEKMQQLFVLSTQTMHWFQERGFIECDINSLPEQRQEFYNYKRNSKILTKHL